MISMSMFHSEGTPRLGINGRADNLFRSFHCCLHEPLQVFRFLRPLLSILVFMSLGNVAFSICDESNIGGKVVMSTCVPIRHFQRQQAKR